METGQLKVRHMLAKRRLMFLSNILKRSKSEIILKMYEVQKVKKTRNDWFQTVQNDKVVYDIQLSDDQISLLSKAQFKRIVDRQVNKKSYSEFLESRKPKAQMLIKSMNHDKQWKVPAQEYLKSNELTIKEKQQLFSLRARSYNLKSNMKNQYLDDMSCRICGDKDSVEDENHVFVECEELKESIEEENVNVADIYGNVTQQIKAMKVISRKMKLRDLILDVRNQ